METKKWYESTTLIGLIMLVINYLLVKYDIDVAPEEVQSTVELVLQWVGALMVFYGRIRASKPIRF